MIKQRLVEKLVLRLNRLCNMSRIFCCCSLLCVLSSTAFAQFPLSVGIKGGVSLTDAYQNNNYSVSTPFLGSSTFRYFSDAKDYIVGPFVQLRLPFGLAVEADGLYRPLSFASNTQLPNLNYGFSSRFITWEFPILAQYRFRFPIVSPYIEGGPSFRTTTTNTQYLSNRGLAFGAGVNIHALLVRVSPEIRYTRWESDASAIAATGVPAYSNQNQVEFLVGLAF